MGESVKCFKSVLGKSKTNINKTESPTMSYLTVSEIVAAPGIN